MRAGVVVFPGTNCEVDTYNALSYLGYDVKYLWHRQNVVDGLDLLVLPGGFSYGDYLRCGAIARFSPLMNAVARFAESGGLVMGICNGLQILLEAGLLPGAMLRNQNLRFVCQDVFLRLENHPLPFPRPCYA